MSPRAGNVRAIRPMRILLVTDDERYAEDIAAAAERRGVDLALASAGDDLDGAATESAPNVLVLDANNRLARVSRTATVFAALHPRIVTVVVANRAPERSVGEVLVIDKWRSAERLLHELEHALLGLPEPLEARRSAGE
jgi:DNA-binding NtrC family response regulator